ncbi:RidA family protein [Mycolicibacterium wolinskyi]|uniref:Translation initiation inhibitor n=1 Tax=Mycolicibacterium wolinskyi TaxID=59750 RepID=A0A1X2F925_9MYCO|nr:MULTISPECIES: RidA family protein [Mycolicibacterium]MCV7286342.1 RidA family protein [Mycolicibacterium wolinskyi]MCV7293322.1 RidA family protein [Mycolicibacterium goodii]ORX14916.1 translation initiation inhibitor [Mycolicibacterium wolinskyi]
MTPRDRLAALGFEVPAPAGPKGAYFPSRRFGDQLWISGTTARRPADPGAVGVVGADVTVEQARTQARHAALNLVAAIDAAVGLDAVTALVHLRGYVRATSDFDAHPAVIDGASTLLLDAFGAQCGAHARTAVGVASLPGGACVELELVATVRG